MQITVRNRLIVVSCVLSGVVSGCAAVEPAASLAPGTYALIRYAGAVLPTVVRASFPAYTTDGRTLTCDQVLTGEQLVVSSDGHVTHSADGEIRCQGEAPHSLPTGTEAGQVTIAGAAVEIQFPAGDHRFVLQRSGTLLSGRRESLQLVQANGSSSVQFVADPELYEFQLLQ